MDFVKTIDKIRDNTVSPYSEQQMFIATGNERHLRHYGIIADELCQCEDGAALGDPTPPQAVQFVPVIGDTIPENRFSLYRPTVYLNEPVQIGAGTITLVRQSDSAVLYSWNVATSPLVSLIIGAQALFINEQIVLTEGETYQINCPAGFVRDLAGNAISAITNWIFQTISTTPAGGEFSDDFSNDFA